MTKSTTEDDGGPSSSETVSRCRCLQPSRQKSVETYRRGKRNPYLDEVSNIESEPKSDGALRGYVDVDGRGCARVNIFFVVVHNELRMVVFSSNTEFKVIETKLNQRYRLY